MLRGYCKKEETEALLAGEPSLDFLYQRRDLRANIKEVLADIESGDTLVVLSARPLVRSTLELVKLLASIVAVGADFRSISEPWFSTESTAAAFVGGLAGLRPRNEPCALGSRSLESVKLRRSVRSSPKMSSERISRQAHTESRTYFSLARASKAPFRPLKEIGIAKSWPLPALKITRP